MKPGETFFGGESRSVIGGWDFGREAEESEPEPKIEPWEEEALDHTRQMMLEGIRLQVGLNADGSVPEGNETDPDN